MARMISNNSFDAAATAALDDRLLADMGLARDVGGEGVHPSQVRRLQRRSERQMKWIGDLLDATYGVVLLSVR